MISVLFPLPFAPAKKHILHSSNFAFGFQGIVLCDTLFHSPAIEFIFNHRNTRVSFFGRASRKIRQRDCFCYPFDFTITKRHFFVVVRNGYLLTFLSVNIIYELLVKVNDFTINGLPGLSDLSDLPCFQSRPRIYIGSPDIHQGFNFLINVLFPLPFAPAKNTYSINYFLIAYFFLTSAKAL